MSGSPVDAAAVRQALEAAVAAGPGALDHDAFAAVPPEALDEALRGFANDRGADALPVLSALAGGRAEREVRRAAKRALYRLSQRGVSAPRAPAPRPVVTRQAERAVRAWVSSIDGSGSRAVWIVFEGGYGGLLLCSLILNDTTGIVEVAGGDITKKRLEAELAALRADQKLPWIETDPARAVGLVVEALRLHAEAGTAPPAAFTRWQRLFESAPPVEPPAVARDAEPAKLERSAELLELPEMAGWFLDPEAVQADALALLQARESRLVVSDQIKSEREQAILAGVIERELTGRARERWARRLMEAAFIFTATGRTEQAALAGAAAAGLADSGRDLRHHPFAVALARRALDLAAEVALGRVSAADVSRKPGPVTAPAAS